ncbi:MAG: hypothetical protein CVV42_17365 [Candidatus Riflebacteria bacterium HGW-Riflebacteria-2]|jgi:hypothetical protein|nr:MAG: hypothetical protein CVV42_17365 [Candidatus Riflebacteria bacterium HGW-Riflebacteria-2]
MKNLNVPLNAMSYSGHTVLFFWASQNKSSVRAELHKDDSGIVSDDPIVIKNWLLNCIVDKDADLRDQEKAKGLLAKYFEIAQ